MGCESLFRNHIKNAFTEIIANFNADNTIIPLKKITVWTHLKQNKVLNEPIRQLTAMNL